MVFGEKSLKVAESMENLATIYDAQGFLQEAKDMLSSALAIELDTLGNQHVEVAVTMNNLGVLETHLGHYEEAKEMLKQSVAIRQQVYGANHHLTICAQQNLAYVEQKCASLQHVAHEFDEDQPALIDSTI